MSLGLKKRSVLLTLSLVGLVAICKTGIFQYMAGGTPIEHRLSLAGGVATGVAWSTDGQKLVTYGNYGQSIEVWTKDGTRIANMSRTAFDTPYLEDSISFINADRFVVTPPEGVSLQNQYLSLSIWDIGTGKVVKNVRGPEPGNDWRYNFANLFAVSTNGKFIATVTTLHQNVTVLPVTTWDHPVTLRLRGQDISGIIVSIAIAPDGSFVGLGTVSGQASVYNAKTGQFAYAIHAYDQRPRMPVQSLAFSPDGTEIATGAGAGIASAIDATPVRVWSTTDGHLVRAFEEPNLQPIRNLKWSPAGAYIGFGSIDDKVRLWNQVTGVKTYVPLSDHGSLCQAFSPDGRELAYCDGNNVKIIKITD